jgi:Domain of unknown function (DUF4253)
MSFEKDIWPYIVGLALVSIIYGTMFYLLPYLFRKAVGSKPSQRIAKNKVVVTTALEAINIIKPKAMFSFEFQEVPGQDALSAFEAAKAEGKGIPVIIGGDEQMRQSLAEMMSYQKPTPEEYIQKANTKPDPYPTKSSPKLPKTWPQVGPFNKERNPSVIRQYPAGFKPIVTIAYIPAASSAEIPAHLKLGSWNALPEADVFVALLRKWQRDYGAELVAITTDVIELRVSRKPTTQLEALKLAREHAKFCPSNEVTIAERAAELMQLEWWHFWWD